MDYLEKAIPDKPGDATLFRFKRDLLSRMDARFAEVSSRGVDNRKVLCDLIISEHSDLDAEYADYYRASTAKQRRKRTILGNIIGSVAFILVLLTTYLGVSFATHDWGHTWIIMVDGILLWVVYLLYLGVIGISRLKPIFHVFARILQALAVVVLSVAVFLFCLAMAHISVAWVVVIGGIIAMFVADLAYVSIKKQKLAIIYYLLYIPAIAAMLYIILGYLGYIPWTPGWLIIPAGVGVDILIIIGELLESKHFEKEMMKSWQEN